MPQYKCTGENRPETIAMVCEDEEQNRRWEEVQYLMLVILKLYDANIVIRFNLLRTLK